MRKFVISVLVIAVGYWLLHSYPRQAEQDATIVAPTESTDTIVDTRDVFRESIRVVMFYAKSGAALIFGLVVIVFLTMRTDFSDALMASAWERMTAAVSLLQVEKLTTPIKERLSRQSAQAPNYAKTLAQWRDELGSPIEGGEEEDKKVE